MKYTISAIVTILALMAGPTAFAAGEDPSQNVNGAPSGAAQAASAGSGAPWWSRRAKPVPSASSSVSPEATTAAAAPSTSAAPPAPSASAAAPSEESHPLATRAAPAAKSPLTLAPESSSTPLGYKVIAGVGVAAAAALYLRNKRRQQLAAKKKKPARIDILARQSVGVRNELLVVEVEGTRLFLGMTPSAIQTLMVLEESANVAEADETEEEDLVVAAAERKSMKAKRNSVIEEEELEPSLLAQVTQPRDRAVMTGRRPSTTSMTAAKASPNANANANAHNDTEHLGARVRTLLTARNPSTAMKAVVDPNQPKQHRPSNPRLAAAGQAKGLLLALEDESMDEPPARKPLRLGDW